MRKHFYYAVFFLISFSTAKSQPVIKWQKSVGGSCNEIAYSIIQNAIGNYVLAGYTTSNDGDISGNHGYNDMWVMEMSEGGNILWKQCYGGANDEKAFEIIQTSDGGYAVAGYTASNNGGMIQNHHDTTFVNYDYWVIKLDNTGNLQWSKCYGGTSNDYGNSIVAAPGGGYFVAGSSRSHDWDKTFWYQPFEDFWIIKIDALGNLIWEKTYGGTAWDFVKGLASTSDGGVVVTGDTDSDDGDLTGNHGISDFWIIKLDSVGGLEWQRNYGGSEHDWPYDVIQTFDNHYVVAGWTQSDDGDVTGLHGTIGLPDFWVLKLDSAGNLIWQKTLGGSSSEEAYSIIENPWDHSYTLSGFSGSTDGDVSFRRGGMWIVNLDTSGTINWERSFGGSKGAYGECIATTSDQGFIVCGESKSSDLDLTVNHDSTDWWVLKLTDNYNTISGNIFCDLNSNLLKDSSEIVIPHIKITETGTSERCFSELPGNYDLHVFSPGSFTVTPDLTLLPYYTSNPSAHTATFPGLHEEDSLNDFAVQPLGSFNDLSITITPMGNFRSGRNGYYMINYSNIGTTVLTPVIILFPDQHLTFVSSQPSPTFVTTDSITWELAPLSPFQQGVIIVKFDVNAIGGTLLSSSVRIEPVAGDQQAFSNYSSYEHFATGSLDPNDISVNRDTIFTNELSSPPYLAYIINFQNVGNDTAYEIRVFNNISPKLNSKVISLIIFLK